MLKRLFAVVLAVVGLASAHAVVPLRPQVDVTGYVIHADLDPVTGKLSGTAVVPFTALEDLNAAVFGLNNALQITSVSDGTNATLTYNGDVTDSTVSVMPATFLGQRSRVTWV